MGFLIDVSGDRRVCGRIRRIAAAPSRACWAAGGGVVRATRGFLLGLHLFVGIGALAGGLAAILDPLAPMGMPASSLEHSPFDTFLIPGILLFCVLGLGNLACAAGIAFRKPWRGYASGVSASALVIWIVAQCAMLRAVAFLHALFFLLGAIMGCLALALLAQEGRWPGTWALRLWNRHARGRV